MFMPIASAPAALHINPDPLPGQAAGGVPTDQHAGPVSAQPSADDTVPHSRAGRVLDLLRKLIEYGQDLARTVQGRTAAATLLTVAVQFGTRDMALILARITRGLRLAAALEERLASRPTRPDADAAHFRAPSGRATHASDDRAKRTTLRAEKRSPLPDVPTAEEIAAALRHRPAAAVIADICRDLGIVPAHPLWREVMTVLCGHGGNAAKFLTDVLKRVHGWLIAPPAADADSWLRPPQHAAACGTGPP
jgi:hypothetical protein